jgi:hypothetical protein
MMAVWLIPLCDEVEVEGAMTGAVMFTGLMLNTLESRPINTPVGGCWTQPAWSATRKFAKYNVSELSLRQSLHVPRYVPKKAFWFAEQYENSVEIDGLSRALSNAIWRGPQTVSVEHGVVIGIEAFAEPKTQVSNAYLRL